MRANQIKTVLGAFTFFALAFTQVTFVAQAVEPAKRAARQTQAKQIRFAIPLSDTRLMSLGSMDTTISTTTGTLIRSPSKVSMYD